MSSIIQMSSNTGSFLTPATEKTKTQAKNSRKKLNHREALSSFWEKLQKKLIFANLSLKTEIFFGVTTFSDIYIIKNDKILPISSI